MIQVAFAGHNRARDLGHPAPVTEALNVAFAMLKAADVGPARLLTGLATGADELAARAWRMAELGPIHAVHPYLPGEDPAAPTAGENSELADTETWLDGKAAEAAGRNPYLKQTRLIIETADLLVVVWTGEKARGAGGTADAVLTAMELKLPVLWIKPAEPLALRLIRPEKLPSDFHFSEFQEALKRGDLSHVETATAETLRQLLRPGDLAPTDLSEPPSSGVRQRFDDWLHSWLWKTYSTFRKVVGGRITGVPPAPEPPEDLAAQPGFQLLSTAYFNADRHANRLSAVHRSEQILLIFAVVLAAIVGSSPTVWPQIKVLAVWTELGIGVAALMVWARAADARQHERWGDERTLAEQLRLERAGWALGVSLASTGVPLESREESDIGRELRRGSGLPHGTYDADRVRRWGEWAMGELIQGQSAYHRAISQRDERIAHRVHLVEDVGFLVLFILLVGYLALYYSLPYWAKLPYWTGGLVIMAGALVPAIAAASVALEAKLEFREHSERSQQVAQALDELAAKLGPSSTFDELQNAARAAMRLHMAEAGHWREGTGRRRLFRP